MGAGESSAALAVGGELAGRPQRRHLSLPLRRYMIFYPHTEEHLEIQGLSWQLGLGEELAFLVQEVNASAFHTPGLVRRRSDLQPVTVCFAYSPGFAPPHWQS